MKDDEEYLISYANLRSGLFGKENKFLDPIKLNKFYEKEYLGVPICLPKNIKYFDYKYAKYFEIEKKLFAEKIFNTKNLNYIGLKKYFRYGNIFAYNVNLKKKYEIRIQKYIKNINYLKKKIKSLKLKKKKICAMQIRNVPHFGHEAIFKHILSNFDYLYLNPIFGIKKKNDFSNLFISKALKFIKKKYNNVEFDPLWTNFHYAGPREALHHMLMRQVLGFDYFYVGRDHAGAENLYNHSEAINKVKKFKHKFKIKPFVSKGGFFCKNCNDYVIKDNCVHKNLKNISGTNFRKYIKKKRLFIHADEKIQQILFIKN
jgi:sulfate adenylyltransferase